MSKISCTMCIVFLLCGVAHAQEPSAPNPRGQISLRFETFSYHVSNDEYPNQTYWDVKGERRKFNQVNPGVGFEVRLHKYFHAVTGAYRNSIYKASVYALVGMETDGGKPIGMGIEGGVVTGYEKVYPAGLAYVRLGHRDGRVNARIAVIPPISGITPPVILAEFRVRVK